MAVPKRRHSKQRSRVRRASIKLTLPQLVKCTNCGKNKLPHQLCKSCKK